MLVLRQRSRVFVIASRQVLIDLRFSSVISAPVFTLRDGLASQVDIGPEDGLKHDLSIQFNQALRVALALD
jgi:mRNA interferase MazF